MSGNWQVGSRFTAVNGMLKKVVGPAFERAVYSSKSFIIALALVKGHLDVEGASLASSVEVDAQIEKWGEVEDSKCYPILSSCEIDVATLST